MAKFHDTSKLWKYIKQDAEKGNLEIKDLNQAFFTDLPRSYGMLYVNGILSDSILDKARNQIDIVDKGICGICSAAEKFNNNLDIIKACQEITSIDGIDTDSFETGLLDATKLLGEESNPVGVALQNLCEIRREILPLMRNLKKENSEEELTLIKDRLLSIAKMPQIKKDQIEAIFLDEAANRIFNPLFENKEGSEIKGQDHYKNFLKLFLHQKFIFANANRLHSLGNEDWRFLDPKKRRIDLSYTDEGLLLQESFFTQEVYDSKISEKLETQGDDFFIKGVAKYKIKIDPYNEGGWLAKYELIDSTCECKEKFKTTLDTRTILGKFREFLETSFDKIIDYLNLNKPIKNQPKLNPLFFVSDEGNSVSKVCSDNNKDIGNILKIRMDNMK